MSKLTLSLAVMALVAGSALAGSELIYEVKPLPKSKEAAAPDEGGMDEEEDSGGCAEEGMEEGEEREDEAAGARRMIVIGEGPNASIHMPSEKSRLVINGEVIYMEDLGDRKVVVLDEKMRKMIKDMKGAAGGAAGGMPGGGAMPAVPPEALKRIKDAIQQLKDKRANLKPNEQAAKPYLDQQIKGLEDTLKRMGGGAAAGGADAETAGKRLVKTGRRDGIKLEWLFMDGKEVLQKIHVVAPGNLDIEKEVVATLARYAKIMSEMGEKSWAEAVLAEGYIPVTVWDYDEEEISTLVTHRTRTVKDAEVKPTPGLTREDPFK